MINFIWNIIAKYAFSVPDEPEFLFLSWWHPMQWILENIFDVTRIGFIINELFWWQILVRNGKNSIDWDEIALKMQSNRTAFDCFSRYQERHNEEHRKFGWTDEENKKLIDSLSTMGNLGIDEIHWPKIRLLFPGRSKTQLYS